ncbi:unnamed protein product [Soboliphyme baturini]|uniref:NADH dehydrogenase [ubiquinone] 1 beta subcomplex subunit 9 n=1 Tax=Soboliphyme baturini TaxID=241478 RepID=A0A183IBW1_9BILA|nr:unnamed protein product [Soboliphyme baturini]
MEAPAWYFSKALSHRQKVLRLYRRAIKTVNSWFLPEVLETRYQKVILRARFDLHKNEESEQAKRTLVEGVRELWEKQHPYPLIQCHDPMGSAYGREPDISDKVLDIQWTYQERDQYPYYFARREQRKKEVIEAWEKIKQSWKPVPRA